jgi:hypothetical protein
MPHRDRYLGKFVVDRQLILIMAGHISVSQF